MIGEVIPAIQIERAWSFTLSSTLERRYFKAAVVMSEKANHKVTFDGVTSRCSCQGECASLLAALRDIIIVPGDAQKSIIATQLVLAFKRAGINIKGLIANFTARDGETAMIEVSEAVRITMLRGLALNLYDTPAAPPPQELPQEKPRGPKTISEQEMGRKIIL